MKRKEFLRYKKYLNSINKFVGYTDIDEDGLSGLTLTSKRLSSKRISNMFKFFRKHWGDIKKEKGDMFEFKPVFEEGKKYRLFQYEAPERWNENWSLYSEEESFLTKEKLHYKTLKEPYLWTKEKWINKGLSLPEDWKEICSLGNLTISTLKEMLNKSGDRWRWEKRIEFSNYLFKRYLEEGFPKEFISLIERGTL